MIVECLLNGLRQGLIVVWGVICCLNLWMMPTWAAVQEVPEIIESLDQHVAALQELVDQEAWLDVQSYIGGPMGLVRRDLLTVIDEVPADKRKEAKKLTRRITNQMLQMYQAGRAANGEQVRTAERNFEDAVAGLEYFVEDVL